jgi:transcriptional regulator with XRE-family HTH domain
MAMDTSKQVGNRIKQYREMRGLTQAGLADLMGKSVVTISNFERGKVATSLYTLEQLARHLGVAVKDFFEDTPPQPLPGPEAEFAVTVRNVLTRLTDDDIERIVTGLNDVLDARRRRKRG